jgi:hypothetical protein
LCIFIIFWNVRSTDIFIHKATTTSRKVWRKSNSAQVRTGYTHGQLCKYKYGISAEIQTPNHWDLIVRSMADSLPLLPPPAVFFRRFSSIVSDSYKEKFGGRFKNVLLTVSLF